MKECYCFSWLFCFPIRMSSKVAIRGKTTEYGSGCSVSGCHGFWSTKSKLSHLEKTSNFDRFDFFKNNSDSSFSHQGGIPSDASIVFKTQARPAILSQGNELIFVMLCDLTNDGPALIPGWPWRFDNYFGVNFLPLQELVHIVSAY